MRVINLLYISMLLALLLAPAVLQAAEVTKLLSRQEGSLEVVEYDLIGELGETEAHVVVTLETGGRQYQAERLALAGDFGNSVKVGRGKRFMWNIAADFPAGFEGDLVWDVTARTVGPAVQPGKQAQTVTAKNIREEPVRITANSNTLLFFVNDVVSLLPSSLAALISPETDTILRESQRFSNQQSWSRTIVTPAVFARELAAPLALDDAQLWAGRLGDSLRHILDVVFSNPKDPLNDQLKRNIRLFTERTPGKTHQITYTGYAGRQTNDVLQELYSLKGRSSGDLYPALVTVTADLWASVWKAQGGASPFAPAVAFVRKPMNLGFREGLTTFNARDNPCLSLDSKSSAYRDCMTSYSERLKQENRQKQMENYLKVQEQRLKYPVKKP